MDSAISLKIGCRAKNYRQSLSYWRCCARAMFPDQMTVASKCIKEACRVGGITIQMLDSRSRQERIIFVRHMIAHHLMKEGIHPEDIGALLNRCRSDVLHSHGSFQRRLDTDKHARARYQKLKESL